MSGFDAVLRVMLIVNVSKPNGPEQAVQRHLKDLPGVLVGNPKVPVPGGQSCETDALLITPYGVLVVEAKGFKRDAPASGVLEVPFNGPWSIGGHLAEFYGHKEAPSVQARQAAQRFVGYLRETIATRQFISAIVSVSAKDASMPGGPVALGDVTVALDQDLPRAVEMAFSARRRPSPVSLDEAWRILNALGLSSSLMPTREAVAAEGFGVAGRTVVGMSAWSRSDSSDSEVGVRDGRCAAERLGLKPLSPEELLDWLAAEREARSKPKLPPAPGSVQARLQGDKPRRPMRAEVQRILDEEDEKNRQYRIGQTLADPSLSEEQRDRLREQIRRVTGELDATSPGARTVTGSGSDRSAGTFSAAGTRPEAKGDSFEWGSLILTLTVLGLLIAGVMHWHTSESEAAQTFYEHIIKEHPDARIDREDAKCFVAMSGDDGFGCYADEPDSLDGTRYFNGKVSDSNEVVEFEVLEDEEKSTGTKQQD